MTISAVLDRPASESAAALYSPNVRQPKPVQELFEPIMIAEWIKSCPKVTADQVCDDLVVLFRRNKEVESVVVCDAGGLPIGLVMRHRFFRMLGSAFGLSLFGHQSIARLMDDKPLIADIGIQPWQLIDRALKRDETTFYDAVLLTDRGMLAGIVTVNDLLQMSRLLQKEATNKQVRTVRDTESMIGHVHASIDKVTETTQDTRLLSDRIAEMTVRGRHELGEMLSLFHMWSEIAIRQEKAIAELTDRTKAADGIIKLIADMADQCNLLAVNASIEAARAGQHGKGFGVVAGEIRGLADQTKQSAVQITRQLHAMTASVNGAASLIREGKQGADRGFAQVKRTEDTFSQLWHTSEQNHEAAIRLIEACAEAKNISLQIRSEFGKLMSQLHGPSDI